MDGWLFVNKTNITVEFAKWKANFSKTIEVIALTISSIARSDAFFIYNLKFDIMQMSQNVNNAPYFLYSFGELPVSIPQEAHLLWILLPGLSFLATPENRLGL